MVDTVNAFVAVPDAASHQMQWTGISPYAIPDPETKDIVFWSYSSSSASSLTLMWASRDQGATYKLVSLDASTPLSGAGDKIAGTVMDSKGAIHCYTYDQTNNGAGYGRLVLTRKDGHVIGYSWVIKPFALPQHGAIAHEQRGSINIVYLNGVECVVYIFNGSVGSTDLMIMAGRATSLNPMSAADFVGLDGTGSDSVLLNVSDASMMRTSHTHCCALEQSGATEDLTLVVGPFNNDEATNPQSTPALDDIWFKQLVRSGANWNIGVNTAVGTTIVAAVAGKPIPGLLCVRSNSTKVGVMTTDGTYGVNISYINSAGVGTTNAIPSPLSTAGRNGFGAFNMDDAGQVWGIVGTTGSISSLTPAGRLFHWDGSSMVTNVADATAAQSVAYISVSGRGWTYGCAVIRVEGDPVAQTVTGVLKSASIFTNQQPTVTGQPAPTSVFVGGSAAFTVAGTPSIGPMTIQWQDDSSGSVAPISGANGTTYNTAAIATAPGYRVRAALTDSLGTVYSDWAQLTVYTSGKAFDSVAFDSTAFDVNSGAAVNLNAAAQSFDTSTAQLLKGVSLAGSALSLSTATAGMSHTVPLGAAAVGQVNASGQLNLSISFGANALSSAVATALASLAKPLAVAAASQATATADLSTAAGGSSVNLAAAAASLDTAAADLAKTVGMSAAALSAAAATADLSKSSSLAASATNQDTATGDINVQKLLAAAASSQASATAVMALVKALSANATSQDSATAALDASAANVVNLAAAAVSQVTSGATLSLMVNLSAGAVSQAVATATLGGSAGLAAAAIANAQASAALAVGKPLAASAQSQTSASTTLWLQVNLSAAALASAVAGGSLSLSVNLAAAALSSTSATATLTGPVRLDAAGASTTASNATLAVQPLSLVLKHSRSAADRRRNFTASDLETT